MVKGDYTMTQLWMIEVPLDVKGKKSEPARLTGGNEFNVGGFSWSPDSTRIAFSATKDPDLGSSDTSDIYVLKVADKAIRKIVSTKGPDTNPVWSPDGRQIAFETSNAREFFFYTNQYIALVPSEGGTPTLLSESFDEEPALLAWSPD